MATHSRLTDPLLFSRLQVQLAQKLQCEPKIIGVPCTLDHPAILPSHSGLSATWRSLAKPGISVTTHVPMATMYLRELRGYTSALKGLAESCFWLRNAECSGEAECRMHPSVHRDQDWNAKAHPQHSSSVSFAANTYTLPLRQKSSLSSSQQCSRPAFSSCRRTAGSQQPAGASR